MDSTAFGQAASVVYVPNQLSGTVSGFTINTGAGSLTSLTGSPFSAGFTSSQASRTAVTPDHRFLYVSNAEGSIFGFKVNADGTLTAIFTPPIAVSGASGISVDATGKFLYVAQKFAGVDSTISGFSINPTTGALTSLGSPVALGAGDRGAQSIAIAGNLLYVVLGVNNSLRLLTINSSTGALTLGGSTSLPFSDVLPGPSNVTAALDVKIDGNNHLYVSDSGFFNAAGSTAGLAAFTINSGTGALTPTSTPTYATGVNPFEITIDPSNRFLYVANNNGTAAGSVSAFTINSGTGNLTAVAGSPFGSNGSGASGVTEDLSGNFLYVTNAKRNTVAGFHIAQTGTAGALTFIATTGTGNSPFFLTSTTTPAAPPVTAVPAASTWSLVVLGVLLAAFSAMFYRREYR